MGVVEGLANTATAPFQSATATASTPVKKGPRKIEIRSGKGQNPQSVETIVVQSTEETENVEKTKESDGEAAGETETGTRTANGNTKT